MSNDLEIRHCRVLVAVHDGGGVGAAARALRVAQSTVSETLLSLERVLGQPIMLRRAGRAAELTSTAAALLPYARSLISSSDAMLAVGARQGSAMIRLGTVESISSFLLPTPLSEFRLIWPQVDVRITIGLCADLKKRLKNSELDACLTIESGDELRVPAAPETLPAAQLKLIVAPDHRLSRGVVKRPALEAQTCVFADPDGAFHDLIRAWFGNAQDLPRFVSAGSVDGVKRGVLASDAIGVLPSYAIAEELSARSLVALKTIDPLPLVSLRFATAATPDAGSPLGSLRQKLQDCLRDMAPL